MNFQFSIKDLTFSGKLIKYGNACINLIKYIGYWFISMIKNNYTVVQEEYVKERSQFFILSLSLECILQYNKTILS